MSEWTIRPATLDDRGAAVALMTRAFGEDDHRAALWDWAFAQNPCTDDLYYVVADTGTALAAQYAALPVAMQHEGRPVRGLISLFTATDPAFQRRGLSRTLAHALYDHARETCPIVFGFPNERSAPMFYEHLDWVDLRPYPQLRRPLRNRAGHAGGTRATALGAAVLDATGRLRGDKTVTVVETADFTGIANPIWEAMKPAVGTATIRDETYLNWRFVQSPFEYRRLVALRDGRPVGLAILATRVDRGKARLMELMVAPREEVGVTRVLLGHVIKHATASGAFGLGVVATRRHPQWRTLLSLGFLPTIPLGPQPSPIESPSPSFGVRVNGPGVTPSRILHLDDWYLSSADQDWI